ncbi:MAG: universal stress protein [Actinomycetia bacterium]|nr:universal stress protein [Actinomycetes bacterium]
MLSHGTAPCVLAGIDGSQSGLDAALWVIDETIELGVPLRLVNVIESTDAPVADPTEQARRMAAAEVAVHSALTAVEATERPVTVEVEILQGRPVQALLEAARSAMMVCVGARGLKHATHGRIGSTAAALSTAARSPVVIVRSRRPQSGFSRAVVIEIDDTARGGTVLQRGLDAATRLGAPVRVLTPARLHADVQAQWDRRLAEWHRRYADLDIVSVSNQGAALDYIAAHAEAIQLLVVDRERRGGVGPLVGAPGNAALRDTDCSIMVCEPHNAL